MGIKLNECLDRRFDFQARVPLASLTIFAAIYFFLIPGITVLGDLGDPNLKTAGIPRAAWRIHKSLTPRFGSWARERVASKVAGNLYLYDVPATEWPIFGSVFYLWATEALQRAWEKDPSLSPVAPVVYARSSIDAALDLVLDPVHHSWVRQHWGEDYLHKENLFFRTLIIAAITAHENLLGSGKHLDMLRDQVQTLSAALDASPRGMLNDYPNECYPIDVLPAISILNRAAGLLGEDYRMFVARSLRAFSGEMLDKRGLPPFRMHAMSGVHNQPSRGIGNSHILIFAPEIWPKEAKRWYDLYQEHFWQERWWAVGFREMPKDLPGYNWFFDVDSGPVIGGFSLSGNAFAIAAAKINGRLDHAYPLSAMALTAAWPLPHGTLLSPLLVSDWDHAPYLGEANLLYLLTQQPAAGVEIVSGGVLPASVYLGLAVFFGVGLGVPLVCVRNLFRLWRKE